MICLWMCCLDVKFSTSKRVHLCPQVHLWVISLDKATVFFLLSSFPIIPVPASSLSLSHYLVTGFPLAFTCQSLASVSPDLLPAYASHLRLHTSPGAHCPSPAWAGGAAVPVLLALPGLLEEVLHSGRCAAHLIPTSQLHVV